MEKLYIYSVGKLDPFAAFANAFAGTNLPIQIVTYYPQDGLVCYCDDWQCKALGVGRILKYNRKLTEEEVGRYNMTLIEESTIHRL